MKQGVFLERPNRFIALCLIGGREEVCHVKNTGRCRELLRPGTAVWLEHRPHPGRKTAYDLVAVDKEGLLINMDAAAPNRVVGEWLQAGGLFPEPGTIRPEYRFGSSRLDFYVESGGEKALIEVKGVTLEEDGIAMFPDAPTARGARHLRELVHGAEQGFRAFAVFVIQMKGVRQFRPNWRTDPQFCRALLEAREAGVSVLAYDCRVTSETLCLDSPGPGGLEHWTGESELSNKLGDKK
ncbi:MAG: DNA/RNA nuclease SfsA [Clostridiales bacterium]|nr:DNA/RNA nuclease SfsA [Clostridiales bacterium]